MICSYTDYINRYMLTKRRKGIPSPGEHHFIATYLLPKVVAITGRVPDYVNPDGMKKLTGDIVYWKDGEHYFGIEVKYKTISLTKNEYDNWIVEGSKLKWPDVFIGICAEGIIILPWSEFRTTYRTSIGVKDTDDMEPCEGKYGPKKEIRLLYQSDDGKGCFPSDKKGYLPIANGTCDAQTREDQFMKQLRKQLTNFKWHPPKPMPPTDQKIDYLELPARDLDAVQAFYEQAFAWTFTDYGPEYRAFTDGKLDGGFYTADTCSSANNGAALIVLYAADIEATQARVRTAGGCIVKDTFAFPGGRRFHFTDPNGNELAVWSADDGGLKGK